MITIKIVEHSGKVHLTEVENYNAEDIFMKLENALSGKFLVLIGSVVIDASCKYYLFKLVLKVS